MPQMARKPFMGTTMGQPGGRVKSLAKSPISAMKSPATGPWLIILNVLGLSNEGDPLIHRCSMRSTSALLACAFLLAASAASADSRVFIIANQADGYGVDQCLAKGEKCGAHAARSYCQSRDFAQASSYRRVDPEEMTGSVPKSPARTAAMPAATNTSPSPANARRCPSAATITVPPHRRPGNDVTLPREAAMGSRIGRASGFQPRGIVLMAGHA